MREENLSDHLGELLKHIYVPETIATKIVDSLRLELGRSEQRRQEQVAALRQRLSTVRTRMDQIYEDKLEGRIDEGFWSRKQAEYREQERAIETELSTARKSISEENVLTVERIFELANRAHSLYLTRNSAERGLLLKRILLNCPTDGASLTPTYRKPFDLIFERAKAEDWSACYGVFEPGCSIPGFPANALADRLSFLDLQFLLRSCRDRRKQHLAYGGQ
jgi:site-specific DNA recombinase